jgi:hypothetical protein
LQIDVKDVQASNHWPSQKQQTMNTEQFRILWMFDDLGALSKQACRRRRRRIWVAFVSYSMLRTVSCCCSQKLWNSDEIVGGRGEDEEPRDQPATAMAGLTQAADGLDPPERFFDALALDRADAIARMPSGAAIDPRAAVGIVLRDSGVQPRLRQQATKSAVS